jgi:Lysine methyltransferase
MTLTVLLPPTARLPPIKTLNDVPLGLLHEAIQYLQIVYNPEIHTSRRIIINNNNHGPSPAPKMTPTRGRRPIHDAESMNDNKAAMESPELESIRVDAFEHEKAYVVRWLTALVAKKTTLHDDYCYDHDHDDQNSAANLESLVQSAAALLAICAGAASAGTRTRTYAFCGVRVQLTDLALRNDDFGSVGAQTWGGACVLAEMIAEAPARFGLYGGGTCGGTHCNDNASVFCHGGADGGGGQRRGGGAAAIRMLELGAGTGLVSLTIAKILETTRTCGSRRRAEIVASDFYPPALENLRLNIQRNFASAERDHDHDSDSAAPSGHDLSLSAHFLNWEEEATAAADPARALESPFDVPFDEVFGADIVYEMEHTAWINACLRRFLGLTGRFHLVIPLRERFARESATIERVFPRVEDMQRVMEAGPTLCITQREDITCEGPDGKGEVEYVHYTIQWAVCGDRGDRGDGSVHE